MNSPNDGHGTEVQHMQYIADIVSRVDERTILIMDMVKEFKEEQDEQDSRHFKLKARTDRWAGALFILMVVFSFLSPVLLKAIQN